MTKYLEENIMDLTLTISPDKIEYFIDYMSSFAPREEVESVVKKRKDSKDYKKKWKTQK